MTVDLPNQQLPSVSMIAMTTACHQAGILELTTNASMVLQNIGYVSQHIKTLKSIDLNLDLFAAPKAAMERRRSGKLRSTNEPSKTAYPGRSSPLALEQNCAALQGAPRRALTGRLICSGLAGRAHAGRPMH